MDHSLVFQTPKGRLICLFVLFLTFVEIRAKPMPQEFEMSTASSSPNAKGYWELSYDRCESDRLTCERQLQGCSFIPKGIFMLFFVPLMNWELINEYFLVQTSTAISFSSLVSSLSTSNSAPTTFPMTSPAVPISLDPFMNSEPAPTPKSEKLEMSPNSVCLPDDMVALFVEKTREVNEGLQNGTSQSLVDEVVTKNRDMLMDFYSGISEGISEECGVMRAFIETHDDQPSTTELLTMMAKLDAKFDVSHREFGSIIGKVLDLYNDMKTVCRTEVDDVRTEIFVLKGLIEKLVKAPRSCSCPFSSSLDLNDLYDRIDRTLTESDLNDFFSFASCSRNQVACLPWILSVPTIFGLFFGMVLAVRCYCCAVDKNSQQSSVLSNAGNRPPANPALPAPGAGGNAAGSDNPFES